MLSALTLILVCQLFGELAAGALGLPVPGPVLGMVLLFVWLALRGAVAEPLARVAGALQRSMALMFVPAGAGVILHARLLGEALLPLGLALILSTAAAILVTGWLAARLGGGRRGDG
jgi:holin-like protein